MSVPDPYADRDSPCLCPTPVVELLDLAVRYAQASLGSSKPDAVVGAQYVKTFMEQPAEVWCAFLDVERDALNPGDADG